MDDWKTKQIFDSSIWHPYPNIQIWTLHFLHKYGETFCLHLSIYLRPIAALNW